MVGHDGSQLNQLFETLADWNKELEALNVHELIVPEMEP